MRQKPHKKTENWPNSLLQSESISSQSGEKQIKMLEVYLLPLLSHTHTRSHIFGVWMDAVCRELIRIHSTGMLLECVVTVLGAWYVRVCVCLCVGGVPYVLISCNIGRYGKSFIFGWIYEFYSSSPHHSLVSSYFIWLGLLALSHKSHPSWMYSNQAFVSKINKIFFGLL